MDEERFDRLARGLAKTRSRRSAVGVLAGAALGLAVRRPAAMAQISTPGGMCGGIGGFPCPDGYQCVDAAGDGCDPASGGRDCSGVCVPIETNPCTAMLCIEGSACCPNCGGLCVPQGTACSDDLCVSESCNQATCGPGEYCCNESCSRCVPLGQGCTREYCGPDPGGASCGANVCAPGEYCCNESCGICAPFGAMCIERYCGPGEEVGESCGPTVCAPGQVCCNASCGICTAPGEMCIMIGCVN